MIHTHNVDGLQHLLLYNANINAQSLRYIPQVHHRDGWLISPHQQFDLSHMTSAPDPYENRYQALSYDNDSLFITNERPTQQQQGILDRFNTTPEGTKEILAIHRKVRHTHGRWIDVLTRQAIPTMAEAQLRHNQPPQPCLEYADGSFFIGTLTPTGSPDQGILLHAEKSALMLICEKQDLSLLTTRFDHAPGVVMLSPPTNGQRVKLQPKTPFSKVIASQQADLIKRCLEQYTLTLEPPRLHHTWALACFQSLLSCLSLRCCHSHHHGQRFGRTVISLTDFTDGVLDTIEHLHLSDPALTKLKQHPIIQVITTTNRQIITKINLVKNLFETVNSLLETSPPPPSRALDSYRVLSNSFLNFYRQTPNQITLLRMRRYSKKQFSLYEEYARNIGQSDESIQQFQQVSSAIERPAYPFTLP